MADSPPSGPSRDERRVFIPAPGSRPSAPPPRPAPAADRPATKAAPTKAAPKKSAPKKSARRRKRWPHVAGGVVLVVVLLAAGGLLWANWKFGQIERVQVSDLLGGGSGTNYLIVGSDSREGVTADDPNAGAFIGTPVSGERSDTLLILRLEGSSGKMLSIPRDLLVTVAETGQQSRINSAYAGGPRRVIQTVRDNLGIPIHRYMEIDFVAFAGLVDAVGGVTIHFPRGAKDDASGLFQPVIGDVTLDGTQALAFVRSRNYVEFIDGTTRADPRGDLGRVERQQAFLRALMSKVGGTRNPVELVKITNSLVGGLRLDDGMSFFDAITLARRMRGLDAEPLVLPTTPFRTSAGAAVLRLDEPAAQPVLALFR